MIGYCSIKGCKNIKISEFFESCEDNICWEHGDKLMKALGSDGHINEVMNRILILNIKEEDNE